ncbi:MAG: ABC transporter permease [Candidatus Sulfopaludibacter sp.]|nr:ABC transporter permease [Candidatus Sulfopaludibacter sp.]
MLKDFVYAARTLRANPAFTAAAVLTLALGIGAGTAIFSVANAVLLRPLPYKDPGRLIYACADLKTRNVSDHLWSGPDYMDLRDHASATLEDVAAVSTGRFNLAHDDGTPEDVVFASVTPNLFRLLGAHIAMGRDFIDADGQPDPATADGAPPPPDQRLPIYAIASQEFFQRRFGGNPAALGQPIAKHGPILVGVVERGTELLFRPDRDIERRPDLWMAQRLTYTAPRVGIFLRLIGRLRPGASIQRAQAQADAVAAQTRAIEPAYRGAGLQFRLEPMQPYLVAQVRPAILALMGAVIFLLLIACSNVANLFLVRASLRGRDLGVRTAMGASWWRLARQMLAEALLVSAAGSALGFGLAWAGVHELLSVAPANLPRLDATRIDPSVLVFSMAAGLAAAVLFGLVPALRAARPDVAQVLRASGRTSGLSGGALLRNFVVVAEVALCFVLLVGSGLMFRSFLALQRTNTGYDPRHVLTFRTMGGTLARTTEERAAVIRRRQEALAAIPGVESVTAANTLPLNGSFFPYRWGKEDALNDFSKFQSADTEIVVPGFFETMRLPLLAGRAFNQSDDRPDVRRMIIDSAFAAKAFPNQNAVGQRILSRMNTPTSVWYEVIGVVAHQRMSSLAEPGREQMYLTSGYFNYGNVPEWALRTKGDAAKFAGPVRAAMAKVDRSLLLTDIQTMDSIVAHAQGGTRFSLLLIAAFAGIAALLAGVGLYGVLSTVVRQRTAEIGVRMALGAAPAGIFGLMIAYGLRLAAVGVAAGLLAASMLTQAMTSMLVGIKATDPLTFAGMAVLFFCIAVLSTWIPARRAAGLDPSAALREE